MLHFRSKLSDYRSKLVTDHKTYVPVKPAEQMQAEKTKPKPIPGRSTLGYMLVLILLSAACGKDIYLGPDEQPIFFEYHFINHAWGYQDFGWLMDGEGKIRSYEHPDGYNLGTHGDYLSLEQLEYNLEQADSIIGEISRSVLDKKKDLIPAASKGEIEDFQRHGADMGLGIFSCYYYDPAEDAYQYVMLSTSGDHQRSNDSKEAEKLVEWLKNLVDDYTYY